VVHDVLTGKVDAGLAASFAVPLLTANGAVNPADLKLIDAAWAPDNGVRVTGEPTPEFAFMAFPNVPLADRKLVEQCEYSSSYTQSDSFPYRCSTWRMVKVFL
jgi:hypothetical protein